jgi:hypothetical protein
MARQSLENSQVLRTFHAQITPLKIAHQFLEVSVGFLWKGIDVPSMRGTNLTHAENLEVPAQRCLSNLMALFREQSEQFLLAGNNMRDNGLGNGFKAVIPRLHRPKLPENAMLCNKIA